MPRLSLLLAVAALAAFMQPNSQAASAHNMTSTVAPFRLRPDDVCLFFGDSITLNDRYTTLTARQCRANHPDWNLWFHQAGRNGDTLEGALQRVDAEVIARHPTVVFCLFGMNDANGIRPDDAGTTLSFAAQYHALISRLQHSLPGVRIILATPTVVEESKHPRLAGFARKLDLFTAMVFTVGKQEGLPVLDLHAPMQARLDERLAASTDGSFLPDGVHPDKEGHAMMADIILKAWGER